MHIGGELPTGKIKGSVDFGRVKKKRGTTEKGMELGMFGLRVRKNQKRKVKLT